MERFTLPIDIAKRKKSVRWGIYNIITGVLFFVLLLFSEKAGYKHPPLYYFSFFVLPVYACWNGIAHIRFRKEARFFEIGEEGLRWNFSEKPISDRCINWQDVKWIKLEKSHNIMFFTPSSFSLTAATELFSAAERYRIIVMVMEEAEKRNIRLVNFEQMAWAVS